MVSKVCKLGLWLAGVSAAKMDENHNQTIPMQLFLMGPENVDKSMLCYRYFGHSGTDKSQRFTRYVHADVPEGSYEIGSVVELIDLKKQEMNGLTGTVIEVPVVENGTELYVVRIHENAEYKKLPETMRITLLGGRKTRYKRKNLKLLKRNSKRKPVDKEWSLEVIDFKVDPSYVAVLRDESGDSDGWLFTFSLDKKWSFEAMRNQLLRYVFSQTSTKESTRK